METGKEECSKQEAESMGQRAPIKPASVRKLADSFTGELTSFISGPTRSSGGVTESPKAEKPMEIFRIQLHTLDRWEGFDCTGRYACCKRNEITLANTRENRSSHRSVASDIYSTTGHRESSS